MKLTPFQVEGVRDFLWEHFRANPLPGGRASPPALGVRFAYDRASTWDFYPDRRLEHAKEDARHVVRRTTFADRSRRWRTIDFHPPELRWAWSVSNSAARKVGLQPAEATQAEVTLADPFWGGVFLAGNVVAEWANQPWRRQDHIALTVAVLDAIAQGAIRRSER